MQQGPTASALLAELNAAIEAIVAMAHGNSDSPVTREHMLSILEAMRAGDLPAELLAECQQLLSVRQGALLQAYGATTMQGLLKAMARAGSTSARDPQTEQLEAQAEQLESRLVRVACHAGAYREHWYTGGSGVRVTSALLGWDSATGLVGTAPLVTTPSRLRASDVRSLEEVQRWMFSHLPDSQHSSQAFDTVAWLSAGVLEPYTEPFAVCILASRSGICAGSAYVVGETVLRIPAASLWHLAVRLAEVAAVAFDSRLAERVSLHDSLDVQTGDLLCSEVDALLREREVVLAAITHSLAWELDLSEQEQASLTAALKERDRRIAQLDRDLQRKASELDRARKDNARLAARAAPGAVASAPVGASGGAARPAGAECIEDRVRAELAKFFA